MSILQCLLLALLGYLSSIYSPWLTLGGWYTLGRPLVAGLVIGVILGDIRTGVLLGCAIQTVFIGLVTPGGSMPADVNYVAWIGIPLAMIASSDASVAMTLSIPLSFLGVLAVLLTVTFNSVFVHHQDKLIEQGKLEAAARIPLIGQITNFVVRFIPIFACNYLGAMFVPQLVEKIPIEVLGILAAFGQVLPLIGFAILLKCVYKRPLDLLYYLVGFVLVAAFKLPIVVVLVFAALFAYINYQSAGENGAAKEAPSDEDDLTKVKRLLSKKDIFSCYRSWLVWNLSVQNMERMQGPAIIRMLGAVKEKLYPGERGKQQELFERHEPFFNTEPYLGCIVPGVVLGMEEENARSKEGIPAELLVGVKTALMGPMAGIGDSLYVGTLIPILLAVGIGISGSTGSVVGPLFYVIAHLGIMFPLTWFLFNRGYSMGLSAATSILAGGIKDRLTSAMNIIGLTIVGAITSEYVVIRTNWVLMQGEDVVIDMNASIAGLFPNLITLLLGLLTFWLMAKKNVKIGWMFLFMFIFAILALLSGLMSV